MEHSKKFQTVKSYYDRNLWTEAMVCNAVNRWITEQEAYEIINGPEAEGAGGE